MPNVAAAPYVLVTRRWTGLWDDDRDAHALRLVGTTVAEARIGEPAGAARYGRLVEAAAQGDPLAIAWLAWSHRPKLVHRGHDLYRADPDEWGVRLSGDPVCDGPAGGRRGRHHVAVVSPLGDTAALRPACSACPQGV